MESILESNPSTASSSINLAHIKAESTPIVPFVPETEIKPQISAPSYFFSLKENDAPPFKKPGKEKKPKLLIRDASIMNEEEVIEMVAAMDSDRVDGLMKFLGNLLVGKKIVPNYNISERAFIMWLMRETIDYAAQHEFPAYKLSCLINIYLCTHLYFKWYYWISPVAVWSYFKELMIRHTIEDSPDGMEVFEPDECYDIVTHFHTAYLTNLPLIHILTFGAYRLRLVWPFKPKL